MQNCLHIADHLHVPGGKGVSPETVRVGPLRARNDGHRIEAEFQMGSQRLEIYFHCDDITLTDSLEACLTCALLPAMRNGGPLTVPGEVSQRLLTAVPAIVDIFRSWDSSLSAVEIQDAVPVTRNLPREQRIGAFFSGGVDSFYTLLKRREEITDLIFVHGFDIRLDDTSLRRTTSEMVHRVASSFGKRVVEVETDLRSLLDSYANWGDLAHGAALAAIGHVLSASFARIFIPATFTYANLMPNGSHPLLDPLWSLEELDFVHDGCEASRTRKVAFLSGYDVALENLRVCWKNPDGAYNCGTCEKCLRTMINLYAAGALDRCTTFDQPLDVRRIRRMIVPNVQKRALLEEVLRDFEGKPDDLGVRPALRRVLDRPQWQVRLENCLKRILAHFPFVYSALQRLRDPR
jgi:hypothetical protein